MFDKDLGYTQGLFLSVMATCSEALCQGTLGWLDVSRVMLLCKPLGSLLSKKHELNDERQAEMPSDVAKNGSRVPTWRIVLEELVYYVTLESNSYKGEENDLDEESCSAMNVNADTLIYECHRQSCMLIGTRSSLMKDHKGMVYIDATSKDAYIPSQSGRGEATAKCWCTMPLTSLRIRSACGNDAQVPVWHNQGEQSHKWKKGKQKSAQSSSLFPAAAPGKPTSMARNSFRDRREGYSDKAVVIRDVILLVIVPEDCVT
ncbi:hypothetical protein MTR67_039080 [Solanum verrucosum]|uniref:Uncharacterized protein n=1 Tax=Solanum verrucosum TaxID=315347 RepID=A0AAF0ZQB3_SOLVR|nr:hypothetical protein MTR67_039080 [Solanum verrucosum]